MHKQEEIGQSITSLTNASNYKSDSIECLRLLQDELKRQLLLLEREQREKTKIKKEIQHTIQQYYTVLVEKKGVGRVVAEDKLSNSYNFVKDIVLCISKDVRVGFQILMLCRQDIAAELSELLLGMFYENFNENDPYLKKNTSFAQILGKKISQEAADENFMKKQEDIVLKVNLLPPLVQLLLKQFCRLQSIKQYFEMLANRVLNKIPHSLRFSNGISRGSVCSPEIEGVSFIQTNELNQSQSISINRTSFQSIQEQNQINVKIDEAVEQYKSDILNKAEMMPVCLRVLCFTISQQLHKAKRIKRETINQFIWEILQDPYFRPFDHSNPNKWNHFKNSYFTDTVHKIQEAMCRKADANFLDKLLQKITNISKEKVIRKSEEAKKKIVINGGCVSYRNLYNLFGVIKQNQKYLKSLNERVTNRANKIHQMNPNFDFFKSFSNPSTSYLVFTQLIYGQSLQKDYQSLYSSIYNGHKIKNMLKQILSDNTFHILPYIQRERFLKDVLQKIISQQEIEGEGNFSLGALQHSQQFIMKIKFLVHLMEKEHIDQTTIFCEMIKECAERQSKNIELFQKNKILLLQCLTTVSKAKKLVKAQKQAEKNIEFHLKIVKILDTMQGMNLCITGASTRPEKEKYTKTGHRGIIIQNSSNCQHQQNIEEGLRHHSSSVQQTLLIYCGLKEVKAAIQTGKDIFHVYEALSKILEYLKQKCKALLTISMEEYNYFESSVFKVVMREIHENLLQNKEKSNLELQFQKQLKDLAFIKPNKIKISGRQNLAELEQVWQIACRYLKNINQKKTPTDKIQSIMEMIQVIKISLRKQKEKGQKEDFFDKQSIEIVLAYCLIRSKPEKILSNINFIQIFLSKDKLLSKQGGALQRLKMAVSLIREHKLADFLALDGKDFEDQLLKNETVNKVKGMRENQKLTSLIGYI